MCLRVHSKKKKLFNEIFGEAVFKLLPQVVLVPWAKHRITESLYLFRELIFSVGKGKKKCSSVKMLSVATHRHLCSLIWSQSINLDGWTSNETLQYFRGVKLYCGFEGFKILLFIRSGSFSAAGYFLPSHGQFHWTSGPKSGPLG